MLVKDPKYRKNISKHQLQLLLVIFKFRFVSSEYLGRWLKKDKSTIYERLLVLVQQDYLRKDYDSTYRLRLRPAVYSLTTKGIRCLRSSNANLSELALRNMYKNKSASPQLVDKSLNVFRLALLLNDCYPDTFDIFTRSELSAFDDFLRPSPDLFLQRASQRSTKSSYQLEVIEAGTYTWIIKKRLHAHQNFYDKHNNWNGHYPAVLFVCGNTSTEKRIHRLVARGYFDFAIYTTTEERFTTNDTEVWLTGYNPDWDDEMEFVGL